MSNTYTAERFGPTLGEVARAWRNRLDERLRPLGLSQAQWLVLLHLSRSEDGLMQKELAERVGIEGPTLVRQLDRMADAGWIERRDHPADRRAKIVVLTPKAESITRRIDTVVRKLREELLTGITADELATALSVLQRIRDAMDRE